MEKAKRKPRLYFMLIEPSTGEGRLRPAFLHFEPDSGGIYTHPTRAIALYGLP